MPSAEEITKHHDADPMENPWVLGEAPIETLEIVPYNPEWPGRYQHVAARIRDALGEAVLDLDHVGSTSVPGLPAKDIIDIDLTVADSRDEDSYLPMLEPLGYALIVRERSWHEHRMLRLSDPLVNLHVFSPDCPEAIRHRLFRDWLRTHPDDRQRYEDAKLKAIPGEPGVVNYNRRKQGVIREIYDRMFRAHGLIP